MSEDLNSPEALLQLAELVKGVAIVGFKYPHLCENADKWDREVLESALVAAGCPLEQARYIGSLAALGMMLVSAKMQAMARQGRHLDPERN